MENDSELLMTTGTTGYCPDCRDERLFVVVLEGEHCCTTCNAAVFELDTRPRRRWRDSAEWVTKPGLIDDAARRGSATRTAS